MPTYEYRCTACGHEFELMQKITDPPRKRCPECGRKVERKIGAGAGLLFKGSGFYITDYRSRDYKAKEKAEVGSSNKTEGTSKPGTPESGAPEKKTGAKGTAGERGGAGDGAGAKKGSSEGTKKAKG